MTGFELPGRSRTPERMDVEAVAPDDLARALADLEWLTALGLAHRPTLGWLERIAAGRRELSVLDVACGGGDMLRRIARWGAARGIGLRLVGVDLNPHACRAAAAATDPALPIEYRQGDALTLGAALRPDVIISAHFAHHLDDGELVRFLRWMEGTARLGWFVNDLHRHPVALRALQLAVRAIPFHRFVVSDAPISVRRSFVRADWEAALAAAGIARDRVEIRWRAPFRWGVGTRPA
jgi:2-polyprenyl-3-methyl-5-hydroxy-6-metoxy-1,4-benzoquinol methylase